MWRTAPRRLSALLPSVALLTLCQTVVAEQAPTGWQCRQCATETGWDLDLTLAPAYVADDAYRFGDYTGLDGQGAYLFGDFRGSYRDSDARYFRFDGFTLSQDFSALFVEGGKQGSYRLRGSYQSIPRRFFEDTVSPFRGNGSDSLILPTQWVRAPITGAMSALEETLTPVEVRRDWDVLKLGIDIRPDSRWEVRSNYVRRERNGRDRSSGSFLFNATELARPVGYTTDDLEFAVAYAADTWHGSVSYHGSYFENDNASHSWDNPFTGQPGADAGEAAAAPDNQSHQLVFAGALRLPGKTVLNGQLAIGSLSQDESLLPYTSNASISTLPLPVTSANADADTLNVNVRAVSSPWRKVTLEAELRFNEYDNRKPINVFDYVITDSVPAGTSATSIAYDYERTELKLRGEYRASRRLKVHLGFDTRRFNRNFQERSRTTTDRLWMRVRHRLGDGADVDVDLFTEERRGSSYEVLENPAAEQNPLMRKYNLSDRDRVGIRIKGSVYPAERWDFGWEFEYGEDDYEASAIGISSSRYVGVGADVNWLIARQGSLFATIHTEHVEADQASSQSFSLPDWSATTQDEFDSASIGFDHRSLFGPVGFRFEYGWSRSRGRTNNETNGLAGRFPDLKSLRETVRLGLEYPLDDGWTIGLDYLYENVVSDDWALDGVGPATVPKLLSLGAQPYNYDVNVIYLSVRFEH